MVIHIYRCDQKSWPKDRIRSRSLVLGQPPDSLFFVDGLPERWADMYI